MKAEKACIIVINKWDLIEKDTKTMDEFRKDVYTALSYMTYAPILFYFRKNRTACQQII